MEKCAPRGMEAMAAKSTAELQAIMDFEAEKLQWMKRANVPKNTIKKQEKIYEQLKIESGEHPSIKLPKE